ncbi:SnoaL-like domain [Serratia quinivorans]|uniref:nuclear transport factor 2 family protein n=1 Tax=Serratia quinivorans TaxID=137545 RepID=UPI000D9CCEB7|nr:nuclear transport factor 2 family protein [Serratia quinivorans]SPZ60706.1 SnoaL-like domain [Serratia quinivorans]VEI65700.1 SnoaL-like domain [Serratia quinivorans]
MDAKEIVTNMWQALMVEADPNAITTYVNPRYRQHSPYVKDGPQGLRDLIAELRADYRYDLVRIIGNDKFAVMHGVHYNWLNDVFTGGEAVVGFDMFRVANGQIIEHWDASVPLIRASVSGHGQLDGATTITQPKLTSLSQQVGRDYVQQVLVEGLHDKLGNFVRHDVKQHHVEIGNGIHALAEAITQSAKRYDAVLHVIAEGEFVAVHSGGSVNQQPYSFWDLLRIDEHGLIAEQWQVAAVYPKIVAHNNGPY